MDWADFVLIAHLLNVSSHVLVEASDLEGSSGSKEGVVSSENNISLLALGLASHDDGVSSVGRVAVHVGSNLNLDQVFILKGNCVLWAR